MKNEKRPVVKLKNVRAAFLALWTPKKDMSGDPGKKLKFECTFILDEKLNATDIANMRAAIEEVKKDPILKGKKLAKTCLRRGDDTEGRAATDGFGPGVWTVAARNTRRNYVVDRDGKTPIAEEDGKVYGGCYVNAVVEIYPFVHKTGGAMACASLGNVQFVKDGEPFGAKARNPEEDFAPLPEEEESVV